MPWRPDEEALKPRHDAPPVPPAPPELTNTEGDEGSVAAGGPFSDETMPPAPSSGSGGCGQVAYQGVGGPAALLFLGLFAGRMRRRRWG